MVGLYFLKSFEGFYRCYTKNKVDRFGCIITNPHVDTKYSGRLIELLKSRFGDSIQIDVHEIGLGESVITVCLTNPDDIDYFLLLTIDGIEV
jgi:hypothetical protein